MFAGDGLKSFWRAVATISMTGCNELVRVVLIKRFALRLVVRPIRSTGEGTLVDIHTEPIHAFYEVIDGAFNCARYVGILDAQDKSAARMACIEPAKKSSPVCTDMRQSGWAGSEAQSWFASCCCALLLMEMTVRLYHY